MKLTGARIGAFLRKPDPAVRAVLVYGPDHGLVRERVEVLMRHVVPDLSDPFRVAELTGSALKDDPARLADETAALSLTGGERVVRVREAGDSLSAVFKTWLAAPSGTAPVVVEAGELSARSSLRKLFESADNAAALPCYPDEGRDLETVIHETLRPHGLTVEADALTYLIDHLGSDRAVTRGELEKLALYKGGPGKVTLVDATACVGDNAGLSIDDVVSAAAGGDTAGLEKALQRAYAEGTGPVPLLRAMQRHLHRLQIVAAAMAAGRPVEAAISGFRPPLHFRVADQMRAQARRWPLERIASALEILTEAEIDCKSTGMPAEIIGGRALLRIAQAASRG